MITCLYCRHDNPDRSKYCNNCGERFDYTRYLRKCPECHHRNAMVSSVCLSCGAGLDEKAVVEPRVPLVHADAAEPEEARFHRAVARGFLARGEVDLAIKQLEEAERHDPDNFQTLVELGIARHRGGAETAARSAFDAAVAACEDEQIVLALGRKLLDLRLPDVAVKAFEKAGGTEGDVGIGRALVALGRSLESIRHFERAIASGHESYEATMGLATAQLERGRSEIARDLLKKAAEYRIKSPSALRDLVDKLIAVGEGDLALTKVRLSADKFVLNANIHRFFGDVFRHFGQLDLAREEYLKASDASEADAHVLETEGMVGFHRDLAQRFAGMAALEEATEEIRLAHGDRTDSFGYFVDMAGLWADVGGQEKAGREALEKAMSFPAAEEPIWRYRMALLFDRLGEPLRAAEELDEAAGLLHTDYLYEEQNELRTSADLRVDLAKALYKLGLADKGREQLKEAVRAGITRADVLLRVAQACCDLKEGAIAEALLDLARPLAQETGDPELLKKLEALYGASEAVAG
jgi:tetratricopeptide (TPR) repeat protein